MEGRRIGRPGESGARGLGYDGVSVDEWNGRRRASPVSGFTCECGGSKEIDLKVVFSNPDCRLLYMIRRSGGGERVELPRTAGVADTESSFSSNA